MAAGLAWIAYGPPDDLPVMLTENAFGPHVAVYRNLQRVAEAREWLRDLPQLVAAVEREWDIEAGTPYDDGSTSWTAPVTRGDGSPAVLKVNWPHHKTREEIDALECWDGDGAVAVYRSDRSRWALLIERCIPGTALGDAALDVDSALGVAAEVALRLWRPLLAPSSLAPMGAVTRAWAELLRERLERHRVAFDHGFVEVGATLLETLPTTAPRDVVVHGDFNPRNILRAERESWLAIDPQPMVGDPAFDPPAVIAQVAPPSDDPRELGRRYHLFGQLTGLDVNRMTAWAVARFVEAALRQFDSGDPDWAQQAISTARVYADLADL
jgi:streptomycin 6-kinase